MSLLRMNVGMAVTMARTAGSRTAFALVSGSSAAKAPAAEQRKNKCK